MAGTGPVARPGSPGAAERSATGERGQQGLEPGPEIGRSARGNEVAVDDGGLVHPGSAGVLHVVPDGADARRLPAREDLGGDRHPSRVTDERDRLAGAVEAAHEIQHLVAAAQLVRREAARDHQCVEVVRGQAGDGTVDLERAVTLLPVYR